MSDSDKEELARDFQTEIIGSLSHSEQGTLAEERQQILLEAFPDSEMAEEYRELARRMMAVCRGGEKC